MDKLVTVTDKMQKEYTYTISEPIGKNFATEFKPELSPKEMLKMGVFGGVYMRDCRDEFPKDWYEHARLAEGARDSSLNFFEIDASQPLAEWRRKGWIFDEDPRGWFQWYCRYYMGRRLPEVDMSQIKRWKNMTRHIGQVKKNCKPGDLSCRRRQRQAILHWAYDSRKI